MDSTAFVSDASAAQRVWAPLGQHRGLLSVSAAIRAALYIGLPDAKVSVSATPLLLVHSINATASAIEMAPVFERQSQRRPVIAIELPGFGAADRPDMFYTPALMNDAIAAAIDWVQQHVARGPVDIMAFSLGCEFATMVVLDNPSKVRTLTLIGPTAMEQRRKDERFEGGRTRLMAGMQKVLRRKGFGKSVFSLLTTRLSMRWFLSRAWGGANFDARLLEHGRQCAHAADAHHAPLDFVSGALFTRGIIECYRKVRVPLWVAHGIRGSFSEYGACPERAGDGSLEGSRSVLRTPFNTGAFPHFEQAEAFDAAYEKFLGLFGETHPSTNAAASA